MTAPGNSLLLAAIFALFVACCGYTAGRLHQRRQNGRDREEAYRDGYDNATRSAMSLAARVVGPGRPPTPAGEDTAEDDKAEGDTTTTESVSSGRHTVPDELVRAATYRLPPDRVFRAKVRNTAPPPAEASDDPANLHVPRPRQS